MRKITTAIFLSLICTDGAFARYTACADLNNQESSVCQQTPGCNWIDDTTKCTACPAGTFDGTNEEAAQECTNCNDTDYIQHLQSGQDSDTLTWSYDREQTGAATANECAVTVACTKNGYGFEYNSSNKQLQCIDCADIETNTNDNQGDENNQYKHFRPTAPSLSIDDWNTVAEDINTRQLGCYSCPDNSSQTKTTNGLATSCTCNAGYHNDNSEGQTDADKNADTSITNPNHKCTENKYPVTVYNDCDVAEPTVAEPKDKCKSTVAYNNKLPDALLSCSPQKTGYHRTDDTLYEKKGTNDTISTTEKINAKDPGTTYELCPIWTANTFYIQYDPGKYDENTSAEFSSSTTLSCADQNYKTTEKCIFTYDSFQPQNGNKEHKIPNETPSASDPSYVFMGWKITEINSANNDTNTITIGDKTITNGGTIQPGAQINNATTINGATIVLTAQWQQCPEGYYACENNSGKLIGCKCPAGSTSAPGATSINNCFINNDTQFCDTNGQSCFKLNICTQTDGVWENCPAHTDDTATCSAEQMVNISAQQ